MQLLLLTVSNVKFIYLYLSLKKGIPVLEINMSRLQLTSCSGLMPPQPVQTSISACPRLREKHWALDDPYWMAVLPAALGLCLRCVWCAGVTTGNCALWHHCQCWAVPHSGGFLDTFHPSCSTNCCLCLLCCCAPRWQRFSWCQTKRCLRNPNSK